MPEPWVVAARYVIRDGRPVIRDLHITAHAGEGYSVHDISAEGITSTQLRRIHTRAPPYQQELDEILEEAGVPVSTRVRARPRTPWQRVSDNEVAVFALDYLTAVQKDDKRPRAWLREEYQRRGQHITDGQIRDRIRQATDRGFLTKAEGPGDRRPRQETDQLRALRRSKKTGRRGKGG